MKTTRRTVLEHTPLAALGLLLPGCATRAPADPRTTIPSETPLMTEYAPQPLPFDPTKLTGLSEKLLRSHHENNYVGAVKKLNAARARLAALEPDAPGFVLHGLAQGELAFKHSVVLHELYFGNLVGGGSSGTATVELLAAHFGGAAGWEQRFRALGASLGGGSGWAILEFDLHELYFGNLVGGGSNGVTTKTLLTDHYGGAATWEERLRALGQSLGGGSGWAILELDLHERVPRMYSADDHSQGLSSGIPLLVLDMYEHSYHMDYGAAAAKYIDAFFANLHWDEIDRRTERALKVAELLG
jgi:superoxide dismutase, Fe-Mn family